MMSLLIPNKVEIISFITFIFLIISFYSNGLLISKKKEFNINFVIGWSIFSLIYILFGAILNIKLNIITHLYSVLSLVTIIKNIKYFQIYKIKKYIFLLPIIFLFINTKSHGFDSFAFILDKVTYLLNFNEFPTVQFRSNYPFTSNLIHYFSNFYAGGFSQNIPALFDLFLVIGSIEILAKTFITKTSKRLINIFIISSIVIFFNPMIMNVYSFSSYEDFHVAYILLVVFYFNYRNSFSLRKILTKKNIYIPLLTLLSVCKATGFIHVGTILLSNLIIFILFDKINLKIAKAYLFLCFLCFFQFFLWQYHIYNSDIFAGNSFKGFRVEIFNNILINYYNQFLVKKLLIFSNFIFMFSALYIFLFTKKLAYIKICIFISITVFFWNLFHLIFFIFFQGDGHALEFHNFFRYLSQFSLVFMLIYLIIINDIIGKNFILILKNNGITVLLLFCLYSVFLIHFKEFRRDLSNEYKVVDKINKKTISKMSNNKKNYNNLENTIINFYNKNSKLLF